MTEKAKRQFEILAGQMDKREKFYEVLDEFVKRNGMKVPDEYKEDWKTWTEIERRVPWRTRPLLVMRIKRAAIKAARCV